MEINNNKICKFIKFLQLNNIIQHCYNTQKKFRTYYINI